MFRSFILLFCCGLTEGKLDTIFSSSSQELSFPCPMSKPKHDSCSLLLSVLTYSILSLVAPSFSVLSSSEQEPCCSMLKSYDGSLLSSSPLVPKLHAGDLFWALRFPLGMIVNCYFAPKNQNISWYMSNLVLMTAHINAVRFH